MISTFAFSSTIALNAGSERSIVPVVLISITGEKKNGQEDKNEFWHTIVLKWSGALLS
ncbi:MAG: hypothetical protein WDO19_32425 [Bacteroidota bacterium]